MGAKEKAKELVDKFARIDGYEDSIDLSKCEYEKQCALIAVDEIIQSIRFTDAKSDFGYVGYWQEVKNEINNL